MSDRINRQQYITDERHISLSYNFYLRCFFILHPLLKKMQGEITLVIGKMYKCGTFGVFYRK